MKKLFLLGFLGYGLLTGVFAQSTTNLPSTKADSPPVAECDVPDTLTNHLSAQHVRVPGTRFYMVLPPGFELTAEAPTSFRKNKDAVIDFIEMPARAVPLPPERTTGTAPGKMNIPHKKFVFNGAEARLMCMPAMGGKSYMLFLRNESVAVIVQGRCQADLQTEQEIKAALLSIVYDPTIKVDPYASVPFRLDDSGCKFKFLQSISTMLIYSATNGETMFDKQPHLTAMLFTGNESMSGKMMIEARTRQIKATLTNVEVKNASGEPINGYPAYECEIYGKNGEKDEAIYFCIVESGNNKIIIHGKTTGDTQNNIAEFRKLAHTIKLK